MLAPSGRSSDPQFECSVDRAAALAGRRLAVRGVPQSATLAVMAGAMNSLWCLQMALVGGPLVGQPQFERQASHDRSDNLPETSATGQLMTGPRPSSLCWHSAC